MVNPEAADHRDTRATLEPFVKVGDLEVDIGAYRATFGGRHLNLTVSQIEVLALLLTNRSRVCSRSELAQALGLNGIRTIDVMLTRIRRQVGVDFIKNIYNLGWIVEPDKLSGSGVSVR